MDQGFRPKIHGPRRQRVCSGCLRDGDHPLGLVHSELACERCGATPCHGHIVETAGGSAEPVGAAAKEPPPLSA